MTAGMPSRDLAGEEAHREFTGWIEAQGYDLLGYFDGDSVAEAFAAGMQAEAALRGAIREAFDPAARSRQPGRLRTIDGTAAAFAKAHGSFDLRFDASQNYVRTDDCPWSLILDSRDDGWGGFTAEEAIEFATAQIGSGEAIVAAQQPQSALSPERLAIAAYAAGCGVTDPAVALAAWKSLREESRTDWLAHAGAVQALLTIDAPEGTKLTD